VNPQWPILDSILYEWQLQITQGTGCIDGDILLAEAAEKWKYTPQCQALSPPRFSQGWLSRFKARHSICYRIQHGEASSVATSAHEEMGSVQNTLWEICGGRYIIWMSLASSGADLLILDFLAFPAWNKEG